MKETGADVPRSEELMLRLAAGARSIGDFEGAVIVYRATVRQFPGSVEAYVQHAEILLKTLDAPFEAYGLLSEAIRLNPRHVRARELLGHTTLDMGRYEELKEHQQAVAVFERVLKDNNLPRFERWGALCGLAKALSGTGDRTGAVRVCQQAARVGIKPPCDCESKMLVRN